MSVSLAFRPASTKPFRFLDLPAEIRNKVYTIILCTFDLPMKLHLVPDHLIRLRHTIETQILRTCRSIYTEANYIMLRTNLFVKVTVRIPFEEIFPLIAVRLPVLPLGKKEVKHFKGFVMSHEITAPRLPPEKPRTFVFLHRDIGLFSEALAEGRWHINRHDEFVSHIVTLSNPYGDEAGPEASTFYTRALQEKLIAAYRTDLRGFRRFQIKGDIPKELRTIALSEITRQQEDDSNVILRELEELKSEGNEHFRNGNGEMADKTWSRALLKINNLASMGKAGKRVFDAGGQPFINRLAELFFDIFLNRAQNYLKSMRESAANREFLEMSELLTGILVSVKGAVGGMKKFDGITWKPSDRQVAKLLYREAVGCRLNGSLDRAKVAIERASRTLPGDAEIEAEKRRIL